MLLFDTDIIVSFQRANRKALALFSEVEHGYISIITQMELLAGSQNSEQMRLNRSLLKSLRFEVLPLNTEIGQRALHYIETHSLGDGLRLPDALIAATAAEHSLELVSGNAKHFRRLAGLSIRSFRL
jgi:predicted nucleic acid-binding protein